ncbi:hypothetical protein [Thermotalea metallivorans]|uniref:Uncharacterized protein n=1 Tax=Thermotalea metallivorans TaxID=520762 RepID=A0A140L0Y7_9FIRM|nr:hypothetical protein [Thermotalea metallivorans]KXG74212.1 hypothetical protein AN619_25300 [Thermotalea metallivorans]
MKKNYRKMLWIVIVLLMMSFATLVFVNNKSNTNRYSKAKFIFIEEKTIK